MQAIASRVRKNAFSIKISLPATIIATLVILLTQFVGARAGGTIHYVNDTAAGSNNGTNWTNAYNDLQAALAAASSGDQIWVAAGTYSPGGGNTDTFSLKNGVTLYGGFPGTPGDEGDLTLRDWQTHITVLTGDIDGNDATDANNVVTDSANIVGDNNYHVVTGNGTNSSAVLDGFYITAGQADSGLFPNNSGAGLYNSASSPTLRNLVFSGNLASISGGGMYNSGSSPSLDNVILTGNSATYGGGMYNNSTSNPPLNNVTFSGNTASTWGGGIFNDRNTHSLTNVLFESNNATKGGGMYNDTNTPTLIRGTFSGNTADQGGGIYNTNNTASLTNVAFLENTATSDGGGMFNNSSSPTLVNLSFSGNTADEGGGIFNENSSPTIDNTAFTGNVANNGGGMVNNGNSSPAITNATFASNTAGKGGGIFNNGNSSPAIRNSIFWGNVAITAGPQIHNDDPPTVRITNPVLTRILVQGGCPAGATCNTTPITTDPQFVADPDAGDGLWTTPDDNDYGNLRLQAGSPAIDKGNNNFVDYFLDLAGKARILGDVDLGAYEWILIENFLPLAAK